MKPDPQPFDADETYELDRTAWNLPRPRPARLAVERPLADHETDPAQAPREVDEAA